MPRSEPANSARDLRTFRLTIAYDGTDFVGWQLQPGKRSLQGALEKALLKVTGEPIRAIASGRTDSGVHALAQVVSFRTTANLPLDDWCPALNANLPPDLVVLDVQPVNVTFHAILDTVRKRYRYLLQDGQPANLFWRHYAWELRQPLDVPAMHRAAQAWVGRHDFASFESSGSRRQSTVRTVYDASVVRLEQRGSSPSGAPLAGLPDAHLIACEIEADGFLYNMVRSMVGTLVAIGRGKRPESWAAEVLESRNRRLAGMTAPAHGLFLVRVDTTDGPQPLDPH